jgi:hypothetical protein
LEEYSVAAHILKLPQSSLCELARNSVIQSGFEMEVKRHWLGQKWYLPGAAGNDINKVSFGIRSGLLPIERSTDKCAKWEAKVQTRYAPRRTRARWRDQESRLMVFALYRDTRRRGHNNRCCSFELEAQSLYLCFCFRVDELVIVIW